ncbi:MAG: type II secretion system F family protein, partial [Candidatus Saccharimonadales bacterium]
MPDFEYTAHSKNGQLQKGTITARDRNAALAALRENQLLPIIVKELGKKKGLKMEIPLPGGGKVKAKDLVIFTRQLSTMVSAGVPILRSLALLRDQTSSPVLKKALNDVTTDIQAGASLSDALEKHPKAFSKIYVNMVRAGETGGILDKVLERLAIQQEKDSALRGKIRGAMIYPGVIFTVVILAFFVLMTFIVPKIGAILTSLTAGKAKLPVYTR